MSSDIEQSLHTEIAELRTRLEEAEETLRAIRAGEVEALLVEGAAGPQLYTLESAATVSNQFRGEVLAQISDVVIAADNEHRVSFLNAAAERQYGVVAADMLGCKLDDVYNTHWLRPGDEAEAMAMLRLHGEWRGENIHITRHGREIPVESTVTQLRALDGTPSGLLAVIRDVTRRKRAEEALRASDVKYKSLFASITEMVTVYEVERDAHGRITERRLREGNRAFVCAVGASGIDEIRGKTSSELFGKEWSESHLTAIQEAMDNSVMRTQEVYRPESGRYYITTVVPLTPDTYLGTARDITERKQAEKKLQEARLQRELLKISEREKQLISQELHDGLCQNLAGTAMMGSLLHRRLTERKDPDAEQAKQIAEMLNASVNEARHLSHGLQPVGPEGDGLTNALAQLALTVSNLFFVDCIFECPEPVQLENEVASTHLLRITQEAINNARKHGQANQILIGLQNTSEGITLTIEDDGIGIPKKLTKKPGMGLRSMGLRACEIGATLTVRRAGKKGTVVTCILPTPTPAKHPARKRLVPSPVERDVAFAGGMGSPLVCDQSFR